MEDLSDDPQTLQAIKEKLDEYGISLSDSEIQKKIIELELKQLTGNQALLTTPKIPDKLKKRQKRDTGKAWKNDYNTG